MLPKLSIAIIERDNSAINDIAGVIKSLDSTIGKLTTAPNFQEGINSFKTDAPHVLFLEVTDVEQGVKELAFLASRFPGISVIVTAIEKNPDWILRLIRAGASEYLTKPVNAAELTAAMQRVARLHVQNNTQSRNKGTVISVYNPSGGMGTTTIAVNLAASLADQKERVVLVDLNLFCSDVTAFLDLTPRYTLSSVTARREQIDANFLKSVIIPHSSGVHVLCAPVDLGEADRIQPEQLREVIAVLQSIYTYVIIDTAGPLFGCNLTTFECSNLLLFVTLLNLPALKNAKRYLATMHNEVRGPDKIRLIINRYIPKDDIKVSDAEKVLNTKTYLTVPNAYLDVKTSINKGVPLITCCPKSPVRKAMDDLARRITAETTSRHKTVMHDNTLFCVSGTRGDLTWHSPITLQQPTI